MLLCAQAGQGQHHVAGQHEAGRRRHPGHAAGNGAAAGGRGLGLDGRPGLLRRPEHPVVDDAPGPQLLAHHPGQGTALGFGQVGDAELGGIQLVAGAQGGDDGDPPGQGGLDQIQLTGDQINGVYDVIIGDCKNRSSSAAKKARPERGRPCAARSSSSLKRMSSCRAV